jgi:hypothetical protein
MRALHRERFTKGSTRCAAGFRSGPCRVRVNLDIFGRGEAAIHVRYASTSDQGGESQRNVAMCHNRTHAPQQTAGHSITSSARASSFNHLVGDGKHRWRHLDAERSRRVKVDNELEFGRLRDREVGGLRAFENAAGLGTPALGVAAIRRYSDANWPTAGASVRAIGGIARTTTYAAEASNPAASRQAIFLGATEPRAARPGKTPPRSDAK